MQRSASKSPAKSVRWEHESEEIEEDTREEEGEEAEDQSYGEEDDDEEEEGAVSEDHATDPDEFAVAEPTIPRFQSRKATSRQHRLAAEQKDSRDASNQLQAEAKKHALAILALARSGAAVRRNPSDPYDMSRTDLDLGDVPVLTENESRNKKKEDELKAWDAEEKERFDRPFYFTNETVNIPDKTWEEVFAAHARGRLDTEDVNLAGDVGVMNLLSDLRHSIRGFCTEFFDFETSQLQRGGAGGDGGGNSVNWKKLLQSPGNNNDALKATLLYAGFVCSGGPVGEKSWDELLVRSDLRQAMVCGIINRVLKEHVLNSLLFGATTEQTKELKAMERKQVDRDGEFLIYSSSFASFRFGHITLLCLCRFGVQRLSLG